MLGSLVRGRVAPGLRTVVAGLALLVALPMAGALAGQQGVRSEPPADTLISAPLISPEEASRVLARAGRSRGPGARTGGQGDDAAVSTMSLSASSLSAASAVPPEITELARGLRNDPDLIFEYVYNNIRFTPVFGLKKGALGTLIDGEGSSFDQAALLVALLRAGGHDARFIYGTIHLTASDLNKWLGVNDAVASTNLLLGSGGIPGSDIVSSSGRIVSIKISHVWVKAVIGGTAYVFDPSFKTHSFSTGVDLGTVVGYDQAAFLSMAKSGVAETADSIQNLNRAGVRNALDGYAGNLVRHIREQMPSARVEDVIGGRTIQPVSSVRRQTALPYQNTVEAEWTEIPDSYRATLRLQLAGIDRTFFADELAGRRLVLTFDGNLAPVLSLDGSVQATGVPLAASGSHSLAMSVDQPYPSSSGTYGDFSHTFRVQASAAYAYAIVNGWSGSGRAAVERQRKSLLEARAAGVPETDERMLGSSLQLMAATYLSEKEAMSRLTGQASQVFPLNHVTMGVMGQKNGPYLDLRSTTSTSSLNGTSAARISGFFVNSGIGSAVEWGAIEKVQDVGAISTVKLMDIANERGIKIYNLTSSNYNSVKGNLDYDPEDFVNIEAYLNAGYQIYLPQSGRIVEGDWEGYGFLAISDTGGSIGHTILGGHKGGYYTSSVPVAQLNASSSSSLWSPKAWGGTSAFLQKSKDPINLATGDFVYEHDDISVGGEAHPFGLGFQRSYNSAARLRDGALGRGWTHNFDIRVSGDSDPFQGLGEDSPVDAAAAIVGLHVAFDLLKGPKTIDRVVIAKLIERWLTDRLIDNVVTVSQPGNTEQFVKLSDGTYNPPPGSASTLTRNADGTFLYRTKHGVELAFGADGKVATWRDPNGVTVSFAYSGGQLQTVANGMGRTLSLAYSGGRISLVSDGTGRAVSYAYDAAGNLTGFTDAAAKTTTFAYDLPGRLRQVFLPSFPTTAFVTNDYDALGRVWRQTNGRSQVYEYFYAAGTRTEEKDPLGHETTWYFDPSGRTLMQADKLGHVVRSEYDGQGRLVRRTLPEGNRTEYAYDARHNVLRETVHPKPGSPLAPIERIFAYHPTWNKVTSATDPRGNVTTFAYDTRGNLATKVEPTVGTTAPTTTYTYNARGQVETVTDPLTTTRFTYDPANANLLSVVKDPAGLALTTAYGYDAVGNVTSATDAAAKTTTFEFDAERRRTRKVLPEPYPYDTEYTYDADGRLTQVRSETGITGVWYGVAHRYDAMGNKVASDESVGATQVRTTTFEYDPLDRPVKATDARGQVTENEYDALGRLVRVSQIPDLANPAVKQTVASHAYRPNGTRQTLTDGRSNATAYIYDGFDRLSRTTYPDGSFEEFAHDAAGNLVQRRTRAGEVFATTYDALGRVDEVDVPWSATNTRYEYSSRGLLFRIWDASGTTRYGYDAAGRLTGETTNAGTSRERKVTYWLDARGDRTRIIWPDGFAVSYSYDTLRRLKSISEVRPDGTRALIAEYTWDAILRLKLVEHGNGVVTGYAYRNYNHDSRGVKHTLPSGAVLVEIDHVPDILGRRTNMAVSDDRHLWRPSANSSTSYAANALNQYTGLGTAALTYDGNGNLTGDGVNAFTYDAANRLVGAQNALHTAGYAYDALGRRVSKTVDGARTSYLHDGGRVIAEYDAANALVRRHVYGPGGDPVATIAPDGTRRYHHPDTLGSVVATTDGSASVLERRAYGPHGEGAPGAGPFGFAASWSDEETGLQLMGARFYSAALGRFLQPDPIGYADGPNLYAYAQNDPVNLIDPTGLYAEAAAGTGWSGWRLMDHVQTGLTGAGFIPGVGAFADVANAGISALRGDLPGFALSMVSAVPVVGDAIAGARLGSKAASAAASGRAGPDFIVSPGGTVFPVPKGAHGPHPNKNLKQKVTGVRFDGGQGGANGQVATMRIMDPVPPNGANPGYPRGYIKYENLGSNGGKPQGVDPYTGKTLSDARSHFPID